MQNTGYKITSALLLQSVMFAGASASGADALYSATGARTNLCKSSINLPVHEQTYSKKSVGALFHTSHTVMYPYEKPNPPAKAV